MLDIKRSGLSGLLSEQHFVLTQTSAGICPNEHLTSALDVDIIPSLNNVYDLGSTAKRFAEVHTNRIKSGNLYIDTSSTLVTLGDKLGATKFYIRDSDTIFKWICDSLGNVINYGTFECRGLAEFKDHVKIDNLHELRFYDNGNYVGFKAPALTGNQIWTLPSADGLVNELLKTDGAGNLSWTPIPVVVPQTKSKDIPLVSAYDSINRAWRPHEEIGDFGSSFPLAMNDYAKMRFIAPWDFNLIVSAVVRIVPVATALTSYRIDTDYGAVGQQYNNRSGAVAGGLIPMVAGQITEIDISPALLLLNADDEVGVKITNQTPMDTNQFRVLGGKFRYA